MKAKKGKTWLLVVVFLLACAGAFWGVHMLWTRAQESGTTFLTRVMAELEKTERTLGHVWLNEFQAELFAMSNNSRLAAYVARINGLDLPSDVYQALSGSREADRQSMISLLTPRHSAGDMERVRAFAGESPEIRALVDETVRRQRFRALYLFSADGVPCLGSGMVPPRVAEAGREIAARLLDGTRDSLSLPAYVSGGRLCADVVVPLVLSDAGRASPFVGMLWVTLDLGDCMERVKAATGLQTRSFVAVVEQQADEGLFFLERDKTNHVPLENWTVSADGIEFGLRRIPGYRGECYTMGQRLLSTSIYFVTVLEESSARTLVQGRDNFEDRPWLLPAGLACAALLVLVLVFHFVFSSREKLFVQSQVRRIGNDLRQEQLLGQIDASTGLAIVCTDFDEHILYANASFAALAGRDLAELPGRGTDVLPQDLAMCLRQQAALVWEAGTTFSSEQRISEKGVWQSYAVHACPYVDMDGYLAGTISIYQNINEKVAAARRCDMLVEQTVTVLHRMLTGIDPYLGRLSALMAEVAVLLAELDGDKSPETARLLSMAGRLCLFGEVTLRREDGGRGGRQDYVTGLALGSVDFGGLPVQSTITDRHERLDGSGLPRHLRGDDISRPARYLGIAEELCRRMHPREGSCLLDWEDLFTELLDEQKFDPVAGKLFRFLGTPQGERVLIRLRRG